MHEIEKLQNNISDAASNNNVSVLNSSYLGIVNTLGSVNNQINGNISAQNILNSSILNGVSNTNKLLNAYAAVELVQKGLAAGKKLVEESFGSGFDLNKIKSQFKARLGSDELGTALYQHISEQAKESPYDINALAKNTSSFYLFQET